MNSLEAISARKCVPPFFTHVSVSCWDYRQNGDREIESQDSLTFSVAS